MSALAVHGGKFSKATFKVTRNARLKIHETNVALHKAYSLESERLLRNRNLIWIPFAVECYKVQFLATAHKADQHSLGMESETPF